MRDSFSRVAVLARHNMILRLRDPGQIISYLAMPMVLMLAFKPLYVRTLERGPIQVVTGMLVIFSVLSMAIVGTAMLTERTWRTWDRLRCTRASAVELLLGKALPVFAVLIVQQGVLLVYGMVVIGMPVPDSVGLLLAAVMVWGFVLLSLGSALAAVVRSHGELGAICDISALVLSALGGAFVPTSMMPDWLQAVAPVSPGYWAPSLLDSAIDGRVTGMLMPAAILLCIGVAAAALAVRRLTHGWGRSTVL
ncbi:ABC transporter permease [Micromonospora sp. NPDC050187]|uniref:ABC transporter permease n=1 Tax=Micromonospora sp. NPDC050187 TaxID=3364277 RepID=UPI0037B8F39F